MHQIFRHYGNARHVTPLIRCGICLLIPDFRLASVIREVTVCAANDSVSATDGLHERNRAAFLSSS
jgi:hypothetical protein